MDDLLENVYYKYPLGCNNLDWFVNEVIKLENETTIHFKNTNKA